MAVVDRARPAAGWWCASASAEARAKGVAVGLRRREAEARCAGLVVLDADDAADARAFEPVVRAVEQLVPRLVLERPGRCRSRRAARRATSVATTRSRQRVARGGARARRVPTCASGSPTATFAAGLAARAAEERALDAVVVPRGESPAFLAPWPVTVLAGSVDAAHGGGRELVDLLARLGLRTLGAFAELPDRRRARALRPSGRARPPSRARGGGARAGGRPCRPTSCSSRSSSTRRATRVDEAAFAAKMLADRLLARLDALGLSLHAR